MRRAAAGAARAGGARPAGTLRGALSSEAPAGRRGGARTGSPGGGRSRAGSVGPQPPAGAGDHSPRFAGHSRAASLSPHWIPHVFVMRVRLEETGEMFRVTNCRGDMTVRELKEELDLMVGIPFNLQRLQYLDQGVLMDDSTLKFHDVVPGGIISLCIWHYDGWTELVLAAVDGDLSKLSCLGITEDSFYQTANSQHLKGKKWKKWASQRAFVALYIASHRGHVEAVQYLLEHGASCFSKTPLGRTALHVAVAMGRVDCIRLLLDHGASIGERDAKGETPISIARRLKCKPSERRISLSQWMVKSGARDPTDLIMKKVFQRTKPTFGSEKKTRN
ncbi:ankyrin repeat domain-containing protein 60 [Tamandua tetradactyla]|uniref:ankyrin repeat domain-containing protein 60 n=1 Tax=Tamandua tetradactyla TaxID=48850 RepID=UPI004054654C